MTFDDIRAAYPGFGLAVYAYEPGRPVIVEVHAPDGNRFEFRGPTLDAALAQAFPATEPEPEPPPENVFD